MWFFKKIVDVYYIILFEWFELFFVSGIFNRMVIILIYLLQKKKKKFAQLTKGPFIEQKPEFTLEDVWLKGVTWTWACTWWQHN